MGLGGVPLALGAAQAGLDSGEELERHFHGHLGALKVPPGSLYPEPEAFSGVVGEVCSGGGANAAQIILHRGQGLTPSLEHPVGWRGPLCERDKCQETPAVVLISPSCP